MKRILAILTIFYCICAVIYAETAQKCRIFAVNLYAEPMDLVLGSQDNPLFQKKNLGTAASTKLIALKTPGNYPLLYKTTAEKKWQYAIDDTGQQLPANIEAGATYCLLTDNKGRVNCIKLALPAASPAICFLDGTSDWISRMEVGVDWATGTAAFTEALSPYTITNFQAFKTGYFSLFWQFADQIAGGAYYIYPDAAGKEYEVFHFIKGGAYLFLATSKTDSDYAVLFDISEE